MTSKQHTPAWFYFALVVWTTLMALGFGNIFQGRSVSFTKQAHDASGALFALADDGSRTMMCSGTMVWHQGGNGVFLTARHCVWDEKNDAVTTSRLQISTSDNELGPFYDAKPYKVSATDDVALVLVANGAQLPTVPLGTESSLQPGYELTNYTFMLDAGKQFVTLRVIDILFPHIPDAVHQEIPFWDRGMLVDGTIAPGSSGSGVFDLRQKALVGVAVGGAQEGGPKVVMPVSRVWNLIADPHPEDLTPKPVVKSPVVLGTF